MNDFDIVCTVCLTLTFICRVLDLLHYLELTKNYLPIVQYKRKYYFCLFLYLSFMYLDNQCFANIFSAIFKV